MLIKRSALSINHPQRNSCSWIMTVLSSKDNSTGTKPTKPAIDSSFIKKNLNQEIQIWINNSATLFINVFTDLIGDGNLFRAEWSELHVLHCEARLGTNALLRERNQLSSRDGPAQSTFVRARWNQLVTNCPRNRVSIVTSNRDKRWGMYDSFWLLNVSRRPPAVKLVVLPQNFTLCRYMW